MDFYDYEPFFVISLYLFTMVSVYHLLSNEELVEKMITFFSAEEKKDETTETTETPEKPFVPYEDKYKEEYKNKTPKEIPKEIPTIPKEKIESLKHSFMIEHTPLGNVLMFYDHTRETFTYYSDNTVPYRYLEVVSRKYVLMNDCVSLYVDMDDEIKEAEKKLKVEKEQEQLREQRKEQQLREQRKEQKEQKEQNITIDAPKKDVFAKLKKYNRVDAKSQIIQPTTNKTVNNSRMMSNDKKVEKENMIIKERANRYSYEGKFANFSFLKKVDKKLVDSNYGMSFSEFKKKVMEKK
jgi:hypothetical protein